MLRHSIIVSLIALSFGAPEINRNNLRKFPNVKIVGGHDVDIKDYPHQISFMSHGRHYCGGSIIDETHVLTAAHCIRRAPAEGLQIRANSSLLEQGGTVVNVTRTYVHPSYEYGEHDYDVGVLQLSEPLKFGTGIAAISLADSELEEGTKVETTGWGNTKENGHLSEQLQAVTIKIVDRSKCRSAYIIEPVTDRMICAGLNKGGKNFCQGDSGGALFKGGIQYGIVSWSYGCGEARYPGVFSNVAALRDFIDSVLN